MIMSGMIWVWAAIAVVLGQMATASASSSRENADSTKSKSASAKTSDHQERNLNSFNYSSLRVDAMYTYGAPSVANPQMSNPGNKCIPGLRMYTENVATEHCPWWHWWCTPTEQITNTDFAAHWNAEDLPHPKISTLALILKDDEVEYLYWECKDEDGVEEYEFQRWPHYSNPAYVLPPFHIHDVEIYEGRLLNVPESVRGPSLEYASIANCAHVTTSLQGVTECIDNYSSRVSSRENLLSGIDTSVWNVTAHMNHETLWLSDSPLGEISDDDQVAVYENTQTLDSYGNIIKKCIISFAGSLDLLGDFRKFLSTGTSSYCGRDGVHIGVRDELRQIVRNEEWATIIMPRLETCHELACVGHSLGGALCNLFTMCANQGEENLVNEDDEEMWDDFNVLNWTKASLPSDTSPPTDVPSHSRAPSPAPTDSPSLNDQTGEPSLLPSNPPSTALQSMNLPASSTATATATGKFVCSITKPHDIVICEDGSEFLSGCASEGDSCGENKECWYAECNDYEMGG